MGPSARVQPSGSAAAPTSSQETGVSVPPADGDRDCQLKAAAVKPYAGRLSLRDTQ